MIRLLDNLNKLLREKCASNLELEIGPYERFKTRKNVSLYPAEDPRIVLCLNLLKNTSKQCISSISCKVDDDDMSIEISSKTHEKHEGKKYNLLLRSAIILLAKYVKTKHVKPITKIVSRAINPISAFSMIKYFNAQNDDLNAYMKENDIEPDNITLENVRTYFDENGNIEADRKLTEEEEAELMKNNEEFGNIIDLVVDLKNRETMDKTRQTYDDTIGRIICPEMETTRKMKRSTKHRTKHRTKHHTKSSHKVVQTI